jgi:hypothetical protein
MTVNVSGKEVTIAMTYLEPTLTLIGQATGVVLGITAGGSDNPACGPDTTHNDCGLELEGEW